MCYVPLDLVAKGIDKSPIVPKAVKEQVNTGEKLVKTAAPFNPVANVLNNVLEQSRKAAETLNISPASGPGLFATKEASSFGVGNLTLPGALPSPIAPKVDTNVYQLGSREQNFADVTNSSFGSLAQRMVPKIAVAPNAKLPNQDYATPIGQVYPGIRRG